MVTVLIISAKIANPSLLKTKIFWKKSYDVITSVHDFAKKKLTCDSNCIAHVFMWPKFRNSSTSVREVIITSLGANLKYCTSVAKGLNLTVRKFWGLISTFVKVAVKKLVGGLFAPRLLPPSPPASFLNRVKIKSFALSHDKVHWVTLKKKIWFVMNTVLHWVTLKKRYVLTCTHYLTG